MTFYNKGNKSKNFMKNRFKEDFDSPLSVKKLAKILVDMVRDGKGDYDVFIKDSRGDLSDIYNDSIYTQDSCVIIDIDYDS